MSVTGPDEDPFEAAERQFQELEELAERLNSGSAASTLPAGSDQAVAALPCPACEAVNHLPLGDSRPKAAPCQRCGQMIDPAQPLPVRLRVLDEVIAGTSATVIVLAVTQEHPVEALAQAMVPALAQGRGRFVVVVLDATEEPQASARLGISSAPAIVYYLAGQRLGGFEIPRGLADLAKGLGRFLGGPAGPLGAGGLPFPYAGLLGRERQT